MLILNDFMVLLSNVDTQWFYGAYTLLLPLTKYSHYHTCIIKPSEWDQQVCIVVVLDIS